MTPAGLIWLGRQAGFGPVGVSSISGGRPMALVGTITTRSKFARAAAMISGHILSNIFCPAATAPRRL